MADIDIAGMLESFGKSVSGQTAAEALAYERQAQAEKIRQMQQAAVIYGDYRRQQQGARMNALSNISTAYQPANNALATLYGGGTGQAPYAARPQGYAPIGAGGAPGQNAYRPTASTLYYPALQDARNPPGSTMPAGPPPMPPTPQLAPAAGSAPAARPSGVRNMGNESSARPTLTASQLARAGEVYGQQPAMRTMAMNQPSQSALGAGLFGAGNAAQNAAPAPTTRPGEGASLPRSEVPMIGQPGGRPGVIGSVNGVSPGQAAALGLDPGPQASGSSMAPRPAATGASGVSFQPTQIFNNPLASAAAPTRPMAMVAPTGTAPAASARPQQPTQQQVRTALAANPREIGRPDRQLSRDQLTSRITQLLQSGQLRGMVT